MTTENDFYDEVMQMIMEADFLGKLTERGIPSVCLLPPLADYLATCSLIEGQRCEVGDALLIAMTEKLLANLKEYGGGKMYDDEETETNLN